MCMRRIKSKGKEKNFSRVSNVLAEQNQNEENEECLNKGGIVQPKPEMREPSPTESSSVKPQPYQERKEIHQAPVIIRKIHACQ